MKRQYPIKLLTGLMPLVLCACVGDRPPPKQAILPTQPSPSSSAKLRKTYAWPQSAQLKALPNYGTTIFIMGTVQNAEAAEQFFHDYQAHQTGQWVRQINSQEGDPTFYHFYYLGKGNAVYVEQDSRQDKWSVTDISQELCDRLIPDKAYPPLFRGDGCHPIKTVKKLGQ